MNGVVYEVRERRWPSTWPRLKRPWELLKDGRPVGFYKTEKVARSTLKDTLAVIERKKAGKEAL